MLVVIFFSKNRLLSSLFLVLGFYGLNGQSVFMTPFERDSTQTATYTEGGVFYAQLAKKYPKKCRLDIVGYSDGGNAIHQFVVSDMPDFSPNAAKKQQKLVFFINNAIHAGEPEGVDASMIFVRKLLQEPEYQALLKRITFVIVPFYNVDGVLNRGKFSRANQNGPTEYGFRGNAKNLDLNRDFIKADTRNAQVFNQIFALWKPDVFVDTHTSNGADYQYTLTLIPTQKDKLLPSQAAYQTKSLLPKIFDAMAKTAWEMTPYVNFEETPDKGITGFLDLPRYSTGYAALHNCLGFMTETHMLKPFPARVKATLSFLENLSKIAFEDKDQILNAKKTAEKEYAESQNKVALQWVLDTTRTETLLFKGFEAGYKPSEVSGLPRLYYDRSRPYQKSVLYMPHFTPSVFAEKSRVYIVPQAYTAVLERLKWNGCRMEVLKKDSVVEAYFYRIIDYKSGAYPYEGHHFNAQVKVEKIKLKWQFRKGDVMVFNDANRYVSAVLEPQGADSFFAWNFFDGILNQKEGYSDYVFEDMAAELLKNSPELRQKLEKKRSDDPVFAKSAAAQLDFVYKNSPYYEPTHRLYPVGILY